MTISIQEILANYRKNRYTSKTKRCECLNTGCMNKRREKSSYCQECSNKHNSVN